MKTKPILFSTQMVEAILSGRKTMTRRIIKVQPKNDGQFWRISTMIESTSRNDKKNEGKLHWITMENEYSIKDYDNRYFQCKYSVGDILWVREKTCYVMKDHAPDLLEGFRENRQTVYGTDFNEDWMKYAKEKYSYKWTPSIFMPKSAARIFLKITDIRAERLQDISEEDAKDEGISYKYDEEIGYTFKDYIKLNYIHSPINSFQSLWQSINGEQSWNDNPFVWVISFERIEKLENF